MINTSINLELEKAILSKNKNIAKDLISKGADVNQKLPPYGNTKLHDFAFNNQYDLISFIIDLGCDINPLNNDQWTPLAIAASYNKSESVSVLLKAKADSNIPNFQKRTPLMWATQFGHIEIVKKLIENGSTIDVTDTNGMSPLLDSIEFKRWDITELLLISGANPNLTNRMDKHNPLSLAETTGNNQIIDILKSNGAFFHSKSFVPPDTVRKKILNGNKKNIEEQNTLKYKSMEETAFKEKCSTCSKKELNELLLEVSESGSLIIIKEILDHGVNIEVKDKELGSTTLMNAAYHGHKDIVDLLIKQGANLNAISKDGNTALTWSIIEGHSDIVAILLKNAADSEIKNN